MTRAAGLVACLILGSLPAGAEPVVTSPPAELGVPGFYQKYLDAEGLLVISSAQVPDEALVAAAALVDRMLGSRLDIRQALSANGVRVAILGQREVTTDIPEYADLSPKEEWDARARGLGATFERPISSAAEENLLGYDTDPYRGENIFINEFAHTIHLMALNQLDPRFDQRLKALYEQARRRGLWTDAYAATNYEEYWAEGVQSWFDANLEADPPNGIHNHVNTRAELEQYDPELATLIAEVFGSPAAH